MSKSEMPLNLVLTIFSTSHLYSVDCMKLCGAFLFVNVQFFLFCSCGEHYNPFRRQHGGPGDSERVQACLLLEALLINIIFITVHLDASVI